MKAMNVHMKITYLAAKCTLNKPEKKRFPFFVCKISARKVYEDIFYNQKSNTISF